MKPKQAEMDAIVKEIYEAIEMQEHLGNTLFVLCGDHGMNDAGGHGASSPGETSPALVFMSPKMRQIAGGMERASPVEPRGEFEYHGKVRQMDLVPTLAGLLGFPVPKNNLGVFIEEFLGFWDSGMTFPNLGGWFELIVFVGSDQIRLLHQNAEQIKKIVEKAYPKAYFGEEFRQGMRCKNPVDIGDELACKWRAIVRLTPATGRLGVPEKVLPALYDVSPLISYLLP